MSRHRLLAALALIALSACTKIEVADDPLARQPAHSDAPTGTAIVSLTVNTVQTQQFDSITLQRVQDAGLRNPLLERQTILTNILPGASRDTSLFVGALASGDYEMRELGSSGRFVTLPGSLLGSFHVEAGQLTDLGRLVLTSINEQALVGRSDSVTGNEAFVRRHAPDHLSLYRAPAAHGWNAPRQAGDHAEAYARSHPLGATGFRPLANGELVGATRMGVLLVRGVDGHWRTAVTGDLEGYAAVAPYEVDGTLAVYGGDLGSLLRLRDNGAIEFIDRGDLPLGSIFFLDHSADLRHWIVGLQRPGKAVFFTSTTLDRGHWLELASMATSASFWTGAPHVWAWPMPNGFGFASTSSDAVTCFAYADGSWHPAHSPGNRLLKSVLGAGDGTITALSQALPGQKGAYTQTHWSDDCGATWREIAVSPKILPGAPLRLPDGAVLEPGNDDRGSGLFLSGDDGRSWRRLSGEPVMDERLWAYGPLLLAVSQRHGVEEIRSSKDRGTTWRTELSFVDPVALERQPARP